MDEVFEGGGEGRRLSIWKLVAIGGVGGQEGCGYEAQTEGEGGRGAHGSLSRGTFADHLSRREKRGVRRGGVDISRSNLREER